MGWPAVSSLNEHLVCGLCKGYLIGATTIASCLHSFCHSCIFKHLSKDVDSNTDQNEEQTKHCPTCVDLQLPNDLAPVTTNDLRSDKLLQTVVYKLVPFLFEDEQKRRLEHRKQLRDSDGKEGEKKRKKLKKKKKQSDGNNNNENKIRSDGSESKAKSGKFSVFCSFDVINVKLTEMKLQVDAENDSTKSIMPRYLLCPVMLRVCHLKKFLSQKVYGGVEGCNIIISCQEKIMTDDLSLADICYVLGLHKVTCISIEYVAYVMVNARVGDESTMNSNDPVKMDSPKTSGSEERLPQSSEPVATTAEVVSNDRTVVPEELSSRSVGVLSAASDESHPIHTVHKPTGASVRAEEPGNDTDMPTNHELPTEVIQPQDVPAFCLESPNEKCVHAVTNVHINHDNRNNGNHDDIDVDDNNGDDDDDAGEISMEDEEFIAPGVGNALQEVNDPTVFNPPIQPASTSAVISAVTSPVTLPTTFSVSASVTTSTKPIIVDSISDSASELSSLTELPPHLLSSADDLTGSIEQTEANNTEVKDCKVVLTRLPTACFLRSENRAALFPSRRRKAVDDVNDSDIKMAKEIEITQGRKISGRTPADRPLPPFCKKPRRVEPSNYKPTSRKLMIEYKQELHRLVELRKRIELLRRQERFSAKHSSLPRLNAQKSAKFSRSSNLPTFHAGSPYLSDTVDGVAAVSVPAASTTESLVSVARAASTKVENIITTFDAITNISCKGIVSACFSIPPGSIVTPHTVHQMSTVNLLSSSDFSKKSISSSNLSDSKSSVSCIKTPDFPLDSTYRGEAPHAVSLTNPTVSQSRLAASSYLNDFLSTLPKPANVNIASDPTVGSPCFFVSGSTTPSHVLENPDFASCLRGVYGCTETLSKSKVRFSSPTMLQGTFGGNFYPTVRRFASMKSSQVGSTLSGKVSNIADNKHQPVVSSVFTLKSDSRKSVPQLSSSMSGKLLGLSNFPAELLTHSFSTEPTLSTFNPNDIVRYLERIERKNTLGNPIPLTNHILPVLGNTALNNLQLANGVGMVGPKVVQAYRQSVSTQTALDMLNQYFYRRSKPVGSFVKSRTRQTHPKRSHNQAFAPEVLTKKSTQGPLKKLRYSENDLQLPSSALSEVSLGPILKGSDGFLYRLPSVHNPGTSSHAAPAIPSRRTTVSDLNASLLEPKVCQQKPLCNVSNQHRPVSLTPPSTAWEKLNCNGSIETTNPSSLIRPRSSSANAAEVYEFCDSSAESSSVTKILRPAMSSAAIEAFGHKVVGEERKACATTTRTPIQLSPQNKDTLHSIRRKSLFPIFNRPIKSTTLGVQPHVCVSAQSSAQFARGILTSYVPQQANVRHFSVPTSPYQCFTTSLQPRWKVTQQVPMTLRSLTHAPLKSPQFPLAAFDCNTTLDLSVSKKRKKPENGTEAVSIETCNKAAILHSSALTTQKLVANSERNAFNVCLSVNWSPSCTGSLAASLSTIDKQIQSSHSSKCKLLPTSAGMSSSLPGECPNVIDFRKSLPVKSFKLENLKNFPFSTPVTCSHLGDGVSENNSNGSNNNDISCTSSNLNCLQALVTMVSEKIKTSPNDEKTKEADASSSVEVPVTQSLSLCNNGSGKTHSEVLPAPESLKEADLLVNNLPSPKSNDECSPPESMFLKCDSPTIQLSNTAIDASPSSKETFETPSPTVLLHLNVQPPVDDAGLVSTCKDMIAEYPTKSGEDLMTFSEKNDITVGEGKPEVEKVDCETTASESSGSFCNKSIETVLSNADSIDITDKMEPESSIVPLEPDDNSENGGSLSCLVATCSVEENSCTLSDHADKVYADSIPLLTSSSDLAEIATSCECEAEALSKVSEVAVTDVCLETSLAKTDDHNHSDHSNFSYSSPGTGSEKAEGILENFFSHEEMEKDENVSEIIICTELLEDVIESDQPASPSPTAGAVSVPVADTSLTKDDQIEMPVNNTNDAIGTINDSVNSPTEISAATSVITESALADNTEMVMQYTTTSEELQKDVSSPSPVEEKEIHKVIAPASSSTDHKSLPVDSIESVEVLDSLKVSLPTSDELPIEVRENAGGEINNDELRNSGLS